MQLVTQLAGVVFTGALTLYLVRALGPSGYGLYALAISVGGLLVLPAGLGLPHAVGRFLADHRDDLGQLNAILRLGLRLQAPAALVASVGLFAAAGLVARAYGHPGLAWPLRWVALAVSGQVLFSFLASVAASVRQSRISLWMAVLESVTEATTGASLVLLGAGVAGATLGRAIGYGAGAGFGLYLVVTLVGGRRRQLAEPRRVSVRMMLRYAGVLFAVDLAFSAVAQVDVLLIAALLSSAAVGRFSALLRILAVLGYLGTAVSAGVSPRLSRGGGPPDVEAFARGIRYLLIVQGLVVAPMLVWARPAVELLLGSGYSGAAPILRVLTLQAFVSAPAALIAMSVTYLGEGRRRIVVVLGTLVVGFVSIFVLLKTVGLVGAAIGDDAIVVVNVSAHLWICTRLITVDVRALVFSFVRTVVAAGAMALPLLALGTDR
ncbi:MAG: oligosaccharide flippase family protein, partial [Trebonia sp.]